jgi:hypothetical protein
MKRDAVERMSLIVLVLLDVDAVRIVEPTSCSAMMCAITRNTSASG